MSQASQAALVQNILILNSHFWLRKLRSSYQWTKNVLIYAFSSGKFLDVRQIAGVKDMTNIMSASCQQLSPSFVIAHKQFLHSQAANQLAKVDTSRQQELPVITKL